MKQKFFLFLILSLLFVKPFEAQHSVARQWNEALLEAIRLDYARPTVHARNLFHSSILMYDSWAVYNDVADTYFLGKTVNGYVCPLDPFNISTDAKTAQEKTISYGMYRLLKHRFGESPGGEETIGILDSLMTILGYDVSIISTDYSSGEPAALGNYLAEQLINYGLIDGANEQDEYLNLYYYPINPSLIPTQPGSQNILDPNRWQPLTFELFIDQSGNEFPFLTPEFLSPEWGEVFSFALNDSNLTIYNRDAYNYHVYHDPGIPPYLDTLNAEGKSEEYKWGFSMVSIWSSHLDPSDSVMWDISPASIGNIKDFPQTIEEYHDFYKTLDGGDPGLGHELNPFTDQPYKQQIVPRGDYTRVLAEFWADGPDSETPPGHWFTILNYVNDHPAFEKQFNGEGAILDDLEWDVKAYFTMSGAVHDAAIAAWGIKGWYDYIRPISAIRYMADHGQSSDPQSPGYSPAGIPLVEGFIEVVQEDDPLALEDSSNVGKVKLYAWRGPDYIEDPKNDVAGVGWILAENWWPYQRPTFITPPFAGYISGHSTFSRAAAEVITLLTGDEYFPGGMAEFIAPKNEFLVFEDGPSMDVVLQWATYRDASDQCSLSRIWGGIHPSADDIPGRKIGEQIGINSFYHAKEYFYPTNLTFVRAEKVNFYNYSLSQNFPNPFNPSTSINYTIPNQSYVALKVFDGLGREVAELVNEEQTQGNYKVEFDASSLTSGVYFYRVTTGDFAQTKKMLLLK